MGLMLFANLNILMSLLKSNNFYDDFDITLGIYGFYNHPDYSFHIFLSSAAESFIENHNKTQKLM